MAITRLNNNSITSITALPSGVGGVEVAQQFRLLNNQNGSASTGTVLTNWEEADTDYQAISSAFSQSSGIFSCSRTGIYLCQWTLNIINGTQGDAMDPNIQISTNSGTSYGTRSRAWGAIDASTNRMAISSSFIFDVPDTSTFRLRFRESENNDIASASQIGGGSGDSITQINFVRLGNT
jgi:hypothetical protein